MIFLLFEINLLIFFYKILIPIFHTKKYLVFANIFIEYIFILIEIDIALDIQGFCFSFVSFLTIFYKVYFHQLFEDIFHEVYYT